MLPTDSVAIVRPATPRGSGSSAPRMSGRDTERRAVPDAERVTLLPCSAMRVTASNWYNCLCSLQVHTPYSI